MMKSCSTVLYDVKGGGGLRVLAGIPAKCVLKFKVPAIINLGATSAGKRIVLVLPSRAVIRLLAQTGLDRLPHLHPTHEVGREPRPVRVR